MSANEQCPYADKPCPDVHFQKWCGCRESGVPSPVPPKKEKR